MKDLIPLDLKRQIAEKIIHGENPNKISLDLNLDINQVFAVLGDKEFSSKAAEIFSSQARGLGLVALHNISRIAFDATASPATQLKASKILADIARELQELHPNDLEPAYMSQKSLTDRLSLLQKEALKRAIPIDGAIIEHEPTPSLDDMLD
jgi:hypothetical protein